MKRKFLVVFNYGMGGQWGMVIAHSQEEIRAKYPKLVVYDDRPPFLTKEQAEENVGNEIIDISDPVQGWWVYAT